MVTNLEHLYSGPSYSATTDGIEVTVSVAYFGQPQFSEDKWHFWLYTVHITNQTKQTVRLAKRHWDIRDKYGALTKQTRIGIAGEQPFLKPEEVYEYTGGVSLYYPSGIVTGYYDFIDESKEKTFEVKMPAFSLDVPFSSELAN